MALIASIFQRVIQVAVILQLAHTLSAEEYAKFGYAVLSAGAAYGLIVGVAGNLALASTMQVHCGWRAAIGLVKFLLPIVSVYVVVSILNVTMYGAFVEAFLLAFLATLYSLVANLNLVLIQILVMKARAGLAALAYLFNGMTSLIGVASIRWAISADASGTISILLFVSLISFLFVVFLLFIERHRSASEWPLLTAELSPDYLTVLKLNASGAIFQCAVIASLNILSSSVDYKDLSQFTFASQIFNQFGAFGALLYPFFLKTSGVFSDVARVAVTWMLKLIGGCIIIIGFSVAVLRFFIVYCDPSGCLGFSGASEASILSGLLIGSMILARAPLSWSIQIKRWGYTEAFSHALAAVSMAFITFLFPSFFGIIIGRLVAQCLLIVVPLVRVIIIGLRY